jgi:hypothetical protein
VGNCATILAGNSGNRKLCLILVLCKNLGSFFTSADSDSWNENRAKACCAAGLQTPEVHKDAEDERAGGGLRDCIEVGQERRCVYARRWGCRDCIGAGARIRWIRYKVSLWPLSLHFGCQKRLLN